MNAVIADDCRIASAKCNCTQIDIDKCVYGQNGGSMVRMDCILLGNSNRMAARIIILDREGECVGLNACVTERVDRHVC